MKNTLSNKNSLRGFLYALPMSAWFSLFFLFPLLIILLYSFLEKGLYGGVVWKASVEAYIKLFSTNYGQLFLRTLFISVIVTIVCIAAALPVGYAIAKSRHQVFFLFLIIIPFWINTLIRINGWIAILGTHGFLNNLLKALHFITNSLPLMYNQTAVIIVLVYMSLPYAVFPIFSAIDKFDFSLLEAARDLGATRRQAMLHVLMPNIRAGVLTAVIFTFIPVFGAYTVPLLVGGKNSYMLGNVIVDQATKIKNWPLASAFSTVIAFLSTASIVWMMSVSLRQAAGSNKKKEEAVRACP